MFTLQHPFIQKVSLDILSPFFEAVIPPVLEKKKQELDKMKSSLSDHFTQGTVLECSNQTHEANFLKMVKQENKRRIQPKNKIFGQPIPQDKFEDHIVFRLIDYLECHGTQRRKKLKNHFFWGTKIVGSGLDVDNIFKKPVETSVIEKMKTQYEESKPVDLSTYSIHDVAALLKVYLNELPETPLTNQSFPQFLTATSKFFISLFGLLLTMKKKCQMQIKE